jgi:dTDP-4-dehydrorhamnose reductase
MRFLLLGGTGQVGEEFCTLAFPKDVEVVAPRRAALELEDPRALRGWSRRSRGALSSTRLPIPTSIMPKVRKLSLSRSTDQRGCPTAARTCLDKVCLDVTMRCAAEPERAPYGVYHFAGAGEATWFEFGKAVVELAADRLSRSPQVLPIRTIDYPCLRCAPPTLGSIARQSFAKFGVELRPWRHALADTIDRLPNNQGLP